jgi:voltage-gated potassium channel
MQNSENNRESKNFTRPGDKVIHVARRKPRRKLRIIPNIPGVIRFFGDIVHETPFLPLLLVLTALFLLSSLGIYLIERPVNAQFDTYFHALWWSFTAMQTQGANSPGPITPLGMIIGAIWSILGTVAFFGVIIATIYAYYVEPKRRPSKAIIDALQYNLEELDNLSIEELNVLRDSVTNVVNARIVKIEKSREG